ncbi:MAG: asparagine synthase (glutamine-hydrolyzing) [Anaerolineales bacterium]
MCGILGLLAPGTQPDLHQQLDLLAHRGPDEAGQYADADIFLGARRLSIIDVAGGQQPMSAADGTVWVAQNGEIYNYLAVRAELEALGYVFHTRCDTEVIAAAYAAWGPEGVRRLRGIFAFAIWDIPRRRLMLARDRFGVKPLYLANLAGGSLAFASEIRPLLGLLPNGPRADRAALGALFSVGFVPGPRTAFEGITKLPPAHFLVAEEGGIRLERYWDLPAPEAAVGGNGHPASDEVVAGFRTQLERAVEEQRMSEVPLGALISGGLDSASIAALLQGASNEQLHTFNIGFEQPGYDETRFAALAASHIGTHHHQVVFREADFERYPAVLAHLEEPQCSATALPIYLLYEACRQAGLTVILTGEGADELLGGYHWFQGDAQARPLLGLPAPLRALLAAMPLPISAVGRRVLRGGRQDAVARYTLWQGVEGGAAAGLLSPELAPKPGHGVAAQWQADFRAASGWRDPFRQFQYFEVHSRLADFINFEVDRMSMAHSIEARVPFLDHELWEYAAKLPSAALVGGAQPKDILRRAMRPLLPPEVVARRKHGLAAPHAAWLRRPRLPDWAEAQLQAAALQQAGYFVPARVQALRAEHQAGRATHSRLLMGVLSTQLWHQTFIAKGRDLKGL